MCIRHCACSAAWQPPAGNTTPTHTKCGPLSTAIRTYPERNVGRRPHASEPDFRPRAAWTETRLRGWVAQRKKGRVRSRTLDLRRPRHVRPATRAQLDGAWLVSRLAAWHLPLCTSPRRPVARLRTSVCAAVWEAYGSVASGSLASKASAHVKPPSALACVLWGGAPISRRGERSSREISVWLRCSIQPALMLPWPGRKIAAVRVKITDSGQGGARPRWLHAKGWKKRRWAGPSCRSLYYISPPVPASALANHIRRRHSQRRLLFILRQNDREISRPMTISLYNAQRRW